jgi:hypothetical protein|tara:strand:- start:6034 stop:6228 length:195 start_codon:yes stop_codon:yes gene_type:complete
MEGHDLAALVQKKLRELMNDAADHVSLGGAKDFAEYQRIVGKIEGLGIAERELLDVAKIGEEEG